MAYKNISGTTMPTFKLRNGRIEIIAAAIKSEDAEIVDKFRIKDKTGYYDVADSRDINKLDSKIPYIGVGEEIEPDTILIKETSVKKMIYISDAKNESLKLVFYNSDGTEESITIPRRIQKDIVTVNNTVDKEIVLFDGTSGNRLTGSGLTITEDVEDTDVSIDDLGDHLTKYDNSILTGKAVRKYIGLASKDLGERSAGKGVNRQPLN